MPRRKPSTDQQTRVDEQQAAMLTAEEAIPEVPHGVKLVDKSAENAWAIYSAQRLSWLPAELLMLARICNLEARIEKENNILFEEDTCFLDDKGKVYQNPRVGAINTLTAQQQRLINKLELFGVGKRASATAVEQARRVHDKRQQGGKQDTSGKKTGSNVTSLLASKR